MKESEAKAKWCPYQGIGVKADSKAGERSRCIGSECMAWRWKKEPIPMTAEFTEAGDGFCGLAGEQ